MATRWPEGFRVAVVTNSVTGLGLKTGSAGGRSNWGRSCYFRHPASEVQVHTPAIGWVLQS